MDAPTIGRALTGARPSITCKVRHLTKCRTAPTIPEVRTNEPADALNAESTPKRAPGFTLFWSSGDGGVHVGLDFGRRAGGLPDSDFVERALEPLLPDRVAAQLQRIGA